MGEPRSLVGEGTEPDPCIGVNYEVTPLVLRKKGLVLCRTKLNLILLNHGAICVIMNLEWSDGVRKDYLVELHQENRML